jgi:diamine N-acetyltransferase
MDTNKEARIYTNRFRFFIRGDSCSYSCEFVFRIFKIQTTMNDNFSISIGGPELLDRVAPLWEIHRQHHAALAPQWAKTLARCFDDRRTTLLAKATGGLLVVLATQDNQDIGYCVSTIGSNAQGEIDSFHVLSSHRSRGIGTALMSRTMEWFKSKSITDIAIDVLAGNDAAERFYTRHGFSPRTIRLQHQSP